MRLAAMDYQRKYSFRKDDPQIFERKCFQSNRNIENTCTQFSAQL